MADQGQALAHVADRADAQVALRGPRQGDDGARLGATALAVGDARSAELDCRADEPSERGRHDEGAADPQGGAALGGAPDMRRRG